MEDKRYKKRLKELMKIYSKLPEDALVLYSKTINTVAFMDVQIEDLEELIGSGEACTPDKQLYVSMVKERDSLIKKLRAEIPEKTPKDTESDNFDNF